MNIYTHTHTIFYNCFPIYTHTHTILYNCFPVFSLYFLFPVNFSLIEIYLHIGIFHLFFQLSIFFQLIDSYHVRNQNLPLTLNILFVISREHHFYIYYTRINLGKRYWWLLGTLIYFNKQFRSHIFCFYYAEKNHIMQEPSQRPSSNTRRTSTARNQRSY